MPSQHMTEFWLRSLTVSEEQLTSRTQINFFDDPGRAGVRGLFLSFSFGGTRTWRCMFYSDSGKSRTIKIGRYPVIGLAAARKEALTILSNPKKYSEKRDPPPTFGQVFDDFLKLYVHKNELRTARVIEQRIRKHLLPAFKHFDFASIRRTDLVKELDDIEEHHGAKMADAILGLFKSMANWHGERNEDYRSPVGRKMKRAKYEMRERTLDDAEIRALWIATEKMGAFGGLIRFALLTGARRSKITQMKWTDIREGVWHIDTAKNEKPNCGRIQLPKMALDIVESQPRFKASPYVFTGARGRTAFNSVGEYTALLEIEMKKIIPDMPGHTIHDLRRSFRTNLSRIGIPFHVAERCIAHRVGSRNAQTYDHHQFFEEMTAAFAAHAEHIRTIVTPPPANLVRLPSARHHAQREGMSGPERLTHDVPQNNRQPL